MTIKKRIQLTLSEESFVKCEELANRYGITPNSFMAFVIGQWLDHNYETNTLLAKKVDEAIPDMKSVFADPNLASLVKNVLGDDKEFKDSVRKQLSI